MTSLAGIDTLSGLTTRAAAIWPDKTAWIFDTTGESFTFADVDARAVIVNEDVSDVYLIPLRLKDEGFDDLVCHRLGLAEGEADLGIIAWGSTIGVVREAIARLRAEGVSVKGFYPKLLWPMPAEQYEAFGATCRKLMLRSIRLVAEGAEPPGVIRDPEVNRTDPLFLKRNTPPLAVHEGSP